MPSIFGLPILLISDRANHPPNQPSIALYERRLQLALLWLYHQEDYEAATTGLTATSAMATATATVGHGKTVS